MQSQNDELYQPAVLIPNMIRDLKQKMISSGIPCQTSTITDNTIKILLAALNIDIPIKLAKKYYSLLLQAKKSADRCKICQKERDKVISCVKIHAILDKTEQEIYLTMGHCPFAKDIYKKVNYQHLLDKLLLGKRFRNRTFDTFIPRDGTKDAYEFCKTWCKTYTPSANGIYIAGANNGNGKTHLAVAILLELIKSNIAGAFIVVPNFLQELQNAFGNSTEFIRIFNTYKLAKILVLDDISAIRLDKDQKAGEWAREQIFMLINYRYEWALPTIITANCGLTELQKIYGKRIVSRIIEMTDYVKNTATDYRLTLKW